MKDSYFINMYRNQDESIYGVLLRADYTAEHETDCRFLLSALGNWYARNKTRNVVKVDLGLYDDTFAVRNGYVKGWRDGRKAKLRSLLLIGDGVAVRPDFTPEIAFRDKSINAAWGDKNFFISGRGAEGEGLITLLRESAVARDLLVFKGRSPVDGDGGLGFLIESRTPQHVLEELRSSEP